MKKLILSAAAFTMLLASCSKDEAAVTSNEALVTFNVAAADMGTRVYGDGVTAEDLHYAIYEKGSYAQPLIAKELTGVFPGNVMSTSFTEKLVKGKTYVALFWADATNSPYDVDWNNQTVKITNPAALESQDENLDAFFKAHEIAVGQNAQTETIELRRPFAQLNVGTADTADAATAGLVVEQTEVTVSAYTQMNLLDGSVDPQSKMDLTYKMANIPSGENKTFTVNGKVYDHLSMNYLLVNTKELVDVTFTVNDGTQNINTSTFAKVPVERNYKTFIVGELLTSAVDFEVYILPDWKKPDYIWPDQTGGNNVTDDSNIADDKDDLGSVVDEMFYINDKTFDGTLTLDESIDGTYGQYYFENVTFNKTLKVTEDLTIFFKNVNFNGTPAISWSNDNTSNRQIFLSNCYVNGTLVTKDNKGSFFSGSNSINIF